MKLLIQIIISIYLFALCRDPELEHVHLLLHVLQDPCALRALTSINIHIYIYTYSLFFFCWKYCRNTWPEQQNVFKVSEIISETPKRRSFWFNNIFAAGLRNGEIDTNTQYNPLQVYTNENKNCKTKWFYIFFNKYITKSFLPPQSYVPPLI